MSVIGRFLEKTTVQINLDPAHTAYTLTGFLTSSNVQIRAPSTEGARIRYKSHTAMRLG